MAVKCFGKSIGVFHIALSGGFFSDGGMCLNEPIDAASYFNTDRLYVYANISGYSNANIRTIFPDGSDDIAYQHGDYMWVYWDWGGWYGTVEFELRNGTSVIVTRTTTIEKAPAPAGTITFKGVAAPTDAILGTTYAFKPSWRNNTTVAQDFSVSLIVGGVAHTKTEWIQAGCVSKVYFPILFDKVGAIEITGSYNTDHIPSAFVSVRELAAAQGDILTASWMATNPFTGEPSSTAYWGFNISLSVDVKNLGDIPETYKLQAWHGTVMLAESAVFELAGGQQSSISVPFVMPEVSSLHLTVKLISTDEPVWVCDAGDLRNPTTCYDESVVHELVCAGNEWVPTGEKCPVDPCSPRLPGDVNGDGVVDQLDVDLLWGWVSFVNERETTYKLTCPENADVTGNGRINIGDATLLMNHVLYPNDPAYTLK